MEWLILASCIVFWALIVGFALCLGAAAKRGDDWRNIDQ